MKPSKSITRPLSALGVLVLTASTVAAAPGQAMAAAGVAGAVPAAGAVESGTYLVLSRGTRQDAAVRSAITKAGGRITAVNRAVGMYTVTAPAGFTAKVRTDRAVVGVTPNRVIGHAPDDKAPQGPAARKAVEKASADRAALWKGATARKRAGARAGNPLPTAPVLGDPLSGLQWDMAMIDAWKAHRLATGQGVKVGVMDTGVEAAHPDIAPNFDYRLSRNFTTDNPDIDGPCAEEPDKSCSDPATVDENEHGTHVAGTMAAARNGFGMVGVAPQADIVNLRVGQDSGFFFTDATVNALTYAADNGIDVVNMSYYIDPWMFNCAKNPKDSPAEQAQQAATITATNRALDYARSKGVTLVAAAGNEHVDLDNVKKDTSSPDYPADSARERPVDSSCLNLPTQGNGVVSVSAVGPSGIKSDFSNWGYRNIDVAAPGGALREGYGTPAYGKPTNMVLSPMPKALALASGGVDTKTGQSTDPFIVAQCTSAAADSCAYYQYLQGTSMASPHAAGVAGLIVSRYGKRDKAHGGLTLAAQRTAAILKKTATDTPCPAAVYSYPGRTAEYDATCTGTEERNSFYGEGTVDALAAVSLKGLAGHSRRP